MIGRRILIGASSALLLAGLTAGAGADMRYHLNASVAERCAISNIDLEGWEDGILRVETQCNARTYRLRLLEGETLLEADEAETLGGDAQIRLRSGQVWVTQTRPGTQQIELHVEDAFALTGALAIRIDAA